MLIKISINLIVAHITTIIKIMMINIRKMIDILMRYGLIKEMEKVIVKLERSNF